MGKFYLGRVSYNGRNYHGWQKQKDLPTVQETLFNTIRSIYEFGRIDVKATSRTDSGVHAFSQVVKMLIPRRVDAPEMQKLLNDALPSDIYIHQLERINKSFKVTHLSQFKEYLYFFSLKKQSGMPFVGHLESERAISLELMKECARQYTGLHHFEAFQYKSDTSGGFERKILDSRITAAHEIFPQCFNASSEVYCFHIKGEGFLKQMVRILFGTMVKVGSGDLSLQELSEWLKPPLERNSVILPDTTNRPGFIAPASGLFLYHIQYPELRIGEETRRLVDEKNFINLFPEMELWKNTGESETQDQSCSFPIEVRS